MIKKGKRKKKNPPIYLEIGRKWEIKEKNMFSFLCLVYERKINGKKNVYIYIYIYIILTMIKEKKAIKFLGENVTVWDI